MAIDNGICWDYFKCNRKAIHALNHGFYAKYKYYHDDSCRRLIDNRDKVFPILAALSFVYICDDVLGGYYEV